MVQAGQRPVLGDDVRRSAPERTIIPRLAAPRVFIRNERESRRHIRGLDRFLRDAIGSLSAPPARLLSRGAFEGPLERLQERRHLSGMNAEISAWLGRDFLGAETHRRFTAFPPYLSEESDAFFARCAFASGLPAQAAQGMHFPGTNHIVVSEEALARSPPAALRHTVAHEILHYASELGGGHDARWRAENGALVRGGKLAWLHEGLTELHAQQVLRENGVRTEGVAYPAETAVASYLQKITGGPALREAYIGGDFTEVRRILDERLGAGTFDVLAGRADMPRDSPLAHLGPRLGGGIEALRFLRERMDAAGVDRSGWRDDPVLRTALGLLNLS